MQGIDPATYRRTLGSFATGITVVTAQDGDRDAGMTVSAFAALSLDPPLVLACIAQDATMAPTLASCTSFAVSMLAEDQRDLSVHFAGPRQHRFHGIPFHRGITGAPLLDGTAATLECRVTARHPGGDHLILVGEVVGASVHPRRPLLHFRSRYHTLAP